MLAIADIAIVVTDAKASAAWWEEKLGFAVHTLGGSGHAVLIAPPGERFVLHLCEGFAPREPGNTGIAFMTDEIGPLVERMLAKGVAFTEPLEKTEFGATAKFADPDGNVFWLVGAPTAFVRASSTLRAPGDANRKARKPAPKKSGKRAPKRATKGARKKPPTKSATSRKAAKRARR